MHWLRQSGFGVFLMVVATACTGSQNEGAPDGNSQSCAYSVEFDGEIYLGTGRGAGERGSPDIEGRLGPARRLGCDDGGSAQTPDSPDEEGFAYQLVGVPAQYAIAFGESEDATMIVVAADAEVPPDVRDLIYGDQ